MRFFVDGLLAARAARAARDARARRCATREVDAAMRATTEALSQVSSLLAIVTAPPIETAEIRHIEVLPLQPQVLMVVIITSTGGVSKRIFTFERPVDPGLATWAAAYLNDQLTGMDLGARTLQRRLADPSLQPDRARVPRLPDARLHRAGGDRPGHALRRRRRAADRRAPPRRPRPDQRADDRPRAPPRPARRAAPRADRARRARPHRGGERGARAAVDGARRRRVRAARAQARHGLADGPGPDGLRRGDRCSSARPPTSCRGSSRPSTKSAS